MNSQQQAEYIAEITRHQMAIYAFIRTMVASAADAQDILQETNIALWTSMKNFTPGTNFHAFATRIAHRRAVDHCRRNKRHRVLVFDTELAEKVAGITGSMTTEHTTAHFTALEDCVGRLTDEERKLTDLRYGERKTIREIAKATDGSESALQNTFMRIRAKLRLCIERTIAPPQSL